VAGADPEGRTGQSTAGATHLIKVAVEAAWASAPVAVFGTDYDTPDGTGVRDYIHVSDLAARMSWRSKQADRGAPARSHIMNCGYGRGFSVQQVLDAVDRVTNRKLVRVIEGRRAGDPDALIADNARIKATLPWQPRFEDLDVIVTHALAWERKLALREKSGIDRAWLDLCKFGSRKGAKTQRRRGNLRALRVSARTSESQTQLCTERKRRGRSARVTRGVWVGGMICC
jgi:UDP-glucose 4-epimerase